MIPVIETKSELEEVWTMWAEKVTQGLIETPENGEEDGIEFPMAEILKEVRNDTAD